MIANDILLIPRIPQMHSILVENAYIILPEQAEMAKDPAKRKLFANAIYEGILDFYGVKPAPPKANKKVRRGKRRLKRTKAAPKRWANKTPLSYPR